MIEFGPFNFCVADFGFCGDEPSVFEFIVSFHLRTWLGLATRTNQTVGEGGLTKKTHENKCRFLAKFHSKTHKRTQRRSRQASTCTLLRRTRNVVGKLPETTIVHTLTDTHTIGT